MAYPFIRRSVDQLWTIDADGNPEALDQDLGATWSCSDHGVTYNGWATMMDHIKTQHNPDPPQP